MSHGPLFFVFSAPSGAGKTTLVRAMLERFPGFTFSVSYTSRTKRPHEIHGKDYFFVDAEDFKKKIDEGFFIEWEEVYTGHYYGTPRDKVQDCIQNHRVMLLDLDVTGGLRFKEAYPSLTKSIFVGLSSLDLLETRLRGRQTESEEKIQMRLAKALTENKAASLFDTIVWNDDLASALKDLTTMFVSLGHTPNAL